jgi:GGDEF domain-containing protein
MRTFTPDTAARSDLGALNPTVADSARKLMAAAKDEGVHLTVAETRRSQERQEMLFQKGRNDRGPVATWTLTSDHTPGNAIDFNGKPEAFKWLQANASKYGFTPMGEMDPGHVAMLGDTMPPAAAVASRGAPPPVAAPAPIQQGSATVTNPFMTMGAPADTVPPAPVAAPPDTSADNPFLNMGAPPEPAISQEGAPGELPIHDLGLDTGKGRQAAELQSMIITRDRLKAIQPANAGHKARLDKLVSALDMQIAGKEPGNRSMLENFIRGTAAGAAEGVQFPVELAGNAAALVGAKDLQNYIEENRALINEDLNPRGTAGTVGEIAGNVVGSAPAAGGVAEGIGKTLIRIAPSTRIAMAIEAAHKGSLVQRVASNVITGLPITAVSSFAAPGVDVPEGATPEEAERIRSTNVANKIKNLAIGIGADALFGAIPHGKAKPGEPVVEAPPEAPLTPARQAQLDQVKAQNAVKQAAKRRDRLDKAQAQSQWQVMNPDTEWKELAPTAKRKIYDDYREQRRNSNVNTSVGAPPGTPVSDPTTGNPPEVQQQLVAMEEQLHALRGERDDARRLAETDAQLNIGNRGALDRAAPAADKNSGLSYIFFDANGQKALNDGQGYAVGDKLLTDGRDAILAAHEAHGVQPRLFRYGGDEIVAIVPKDKAQLILDHVEQNSVKQYGDQTGSFSGAVHDTMGDALSVEGKAQLTSRKLEAKAKQGIPGRNAEEQALIDAARERINTSPPPAAAPAAATAKPYDVTDPFPPDAMDAVRQVHEAGGLRDSESQKAFAEEIKSLYDKQLPPDQHASELQSLIEDFTPAEAEGGPPAVKAPPAQAPGATTRVTSAQREAIATARAAEAKARTSGASGDAAKADKAIQAMSDSLGELGKTRPGESYDQWLARVFAEDFSAPAAQAPSVGETPAAGTEGTVSPTPAPPPQKTMLRSIENAKALEDMTEKELGKVDDKLTDAVESLPKDSPERAIVQSDFDAVHNEYARRNAALNANKPAVEPAAPARFGNPADEIAKGGARPEQGPTTPPEVARLRSISPRKMTGDELNSHIADLEGMQKVEEDPQRIAELQKRMNKALEERAFRDKVTNGVIPTIERKAIEGTAGFAFGFATAPGENKDSDGPDRMTNALMWTAIGLAGGLAVARMRAKARAVEVKAEPSDQWLGSRKAAEKIVNYEDTEDPSQSWRERAREWYQGIVRRSHGIDVAVNVLTGSKGGAESLAAHKNPAKLAAMFGRWISMSESALMDRPAYVDYAGNVQDLGVPSYREIVEMVEGDLKGLGKLMTARTSIEGRGLRTVPLDPVTSDLVFNSAPENYHQAADAMRQFDLAMTKVLANEGILSPDAVGKFSMEEFYAGLKKVFDPDGGPSKVVRDPKTKKILIQPNPVKGRKTGVGSKVYNPAETTASMVPQIYRAAELNSIKSRFVDLWEAAGKPDYMLKQIERRKQTISGDQQLRIDALKQEIKGLSQGDAESLVSAFDPKSLDPRSNIMTVYREGVMRAYKVDEHVAQSLASLTPDELEGMWKVLGMPANMAKKGVVLNPYFVAKQSFIDGWQAMLNSQYGFRPGVDQFIGWMNIVRHTPEYQGFIAAGGGHSTLQSHDYANVKTAIAAVKGGGGGPLSTAVNQLKQFKPVEAWKTLIVPFSESARVGEYLRARNHGASPLDALYAAKHVTANFQQRGGFTAMRGLDRASMFLNPAIQGLDQATFRAGINPFRVPEEGRKAAAAKYLSKAFVGITLPSMYFWFMNKDDQEINDLRKTPSGEKYWFMRSPVDAPKMGLQKGDIVKIPKPIVDGQVFGTSMEAYLDKAYGNDPSQMSAAGAAMAKDISFNILPTAGVLYYGLQFNRNIPLGGSLIPQGDENLAPEHQGEDRASWVSRTVAQKISPLVGPNTPDLIKNATTPAGLDYIMNSVGGMLGQDGMLAISQAVEAETKGYPPAKEELPIVSKVFAAYPAMNVAPIRRFYDRAAQVQTVGATINHLVGEDPTRLLPYMTSNQADYALLGVFTKTRQDIANFRRALQDVKDMPGEAISASDRRAMIKQYQVMMIETARQANVFASEVDKAMPNR